jgi:hypothetical protein
MLRFAFRLLRRFVWLASGFVLGWMSSFALTRRVRRATQRYVPAEMRDRLRTNVRAAVDEGRGAMRAREAELKGSIGRNGGK